MTYGSDSFDILLESVMPNTSSVLIEAVLRVRDL